MPESYAEREVIRLEAGYPGWQVWVVPKVVGPDAWCARKHADESQVLNANSPGELERLIGEASTEGRP